MHNARCYAQCYAQCYAMLNATHHHQGRARCVRYLVITPYRQASHPRVQLVRLAAMLRGGKGGKGGGRRRTALALNASFTPCAIPTLYLLWL